MGVKRRTLSFANSTLAVEWADEGAEKLVRFLFAAVPEGDLPQVHFAFWLSMLKPGDMLSLVTSDPAESRRAAFGQMGVYLMDRACYHLADRSQGGLLFHAACVSQAGKAWMLPGPSGAGKSTLALWLALHGYTYQTDELVFVPDGSFSCQALTRPVHLKKTIIPVIGAAFPDLLAGGASQPAGAGYLVPPAALGRQAEGEAMELTGIVFPKYQAGSSFAITPMSGASAAVALTSLLLNARNLPEHGFPELLRLARSLPAYQLTYGGFEQIGERFLHFKLA